MVINRNNGKRLLIETLRYKVNHNIITVHSLKFAVTLTDNSKCKVISVMMTLIQLN